MIKLQLFSTALLLILPALALASDRGSTETPQEHDSHHGHGSHHGPGEQGLHHDFSDVEKWAAVFEGDDRDSWQNPQGVVDLMDLRPGMTVADLGAGSGYFLPYLSEAVGSEGRVLGLDPEPNFVTFMTHRVREAGWSNVEARQIPLDSPALEDGSTDRILIVNTWHHIGNREDYAAKLRKALTKSGAVYVVDFTDRSPHGPPVDSRLPPQQVIEELRAGGFEAEQAPADLPWQYVIVARRR